MSRHSQSLDFLQPDRAENQERAEHDFKTEKQYRERQVHSRNDLIIASIAASSSAFTTILAGFP